MARDYTHRYIIDGKTFLLEFHTEWENDETSVTDCPICDAQGHRVAELDLDRADDYYFDGSAARNKPPVIEIKHALAEDGHRPLSEQEKAEWDVFDLSRRLKQREVWNQGNRRYVETSRAYIETARQRAEADHERAKKQLAEGEAELADLKTALAEAQKRFSAIK